MARPILDAPPMTRAKPGTPSAVLIEVKDSSWLPILLELKITKFEFLIAFGFVEFVE
jgi:hypothetical protein